LKTKLTLDRMAIEEAGPQEEQLAQAIHRQLGRATGPIPIEEIATALDITEIRYEKLESFEGALLTTPERDTGSILINAQSARPRRRFTLAHELGHYLNVWHKPHSEAGFVCGKNDIRIGGFVIKPGLTVHEVQELQANRFAIELLAPKNRIAALSHDDPSVRDVLRTAAEFELSKEAAARRYVDLHPAKVAVVFTLNGDVKYVVTSPTCPRLAMPKRTKILSQSKFQAGQTSCAEIEVDLSVLNGQITTKMADAETFYQEGGHAFTILNFERDQEDDEDNGFEDTVERFSRS
jgi:Zn-dependent peptidase ImmA (M78 family)